MGNKVKLADFTGGAGPGFDRDHYLRDLERAQTRLLSIQQAYLMQGKRAVVLFEGTDAAGKGGTIKRMTEQLDPRFCKVWPIGAPNEIERRQHYLARFIARLPEPGSIAVFDRSWYGRVLVERVEGLIPRPVWRRAFDEIRSFEAMLIADGIRLVKLYLHIDRDEQAARFIERIAEPYKRWKITERDFAAREFFEDYVHAAEDMIARTHDRDGAPWQVIAAKNKHYARLTALNAIADHLAAGIDLTPPEPDAILCRLAIERLGIDPRSAR